MGNEKFQIVKVERLDNFIKKLKLPQIDLIKIDAEGAEYLILKGAKNLIKKYLPILVIETHPWIVNNIDKKIESFLKAYKYKIKKFEAFSDELKFYSGSVIFAY